MKIVSSSSASKWVLLRLCNSVCVMAVMSIFVFVGASLLAIAG
jgi:hypothetical protein